MSAAAGAGALQDADTALAAFKVDAAIVHLAAAVRELTAAGDPRGAAMASARLGDVYHNYLGNKVAGRPWYRRAIRLVEDEEPCVEQGWAAVAMIGCDVDDPAVLRDRAELALERARRFGDIDLEIKALADGGLARVNLGLIDEGMTMLDEAMALASGDGAGDESARGKSVCSFYTACYFTADFARVESWSRALRSHGIIGDAPGPQAFLSSHCDSVAATLLCLVGRWGDAEQVLLRALAAIEAAMPGTAWHPPIALAELRILQGRLHEAEALLLGRDHEIQALVPMARLHLARGDIELAVAAARRGLRSMGADRVRAAALLGVLVDAELRRGDVAAAAAASRELEARVAAVDLPPLLAEAAGLRARVFEAQGAPAAAVDALREGLDRIAGSDLALAQMHLHCQLAALLEYTDRPAAVVEARAASALLAHLDIVVRADDRALLDRLGAAAGAPAATATTECRPATLQADGTWWTIADGDTRARLRETKGLRYLADLIAHPGVERHCLDLVDLVEGAAPEGVDRRRFGDAGPLMDAQARDSCRRRLSDLRDEVEDALAVEDDGRAALLQAEIDAVVAELARAFGIGGRARRASSTVERARLNVTRAIRTAAAMIGSGLPDAGAVLDRRVRTGIFCAYEPHPKDAVTWSVRRSVQA